MVTSFGYAGLAPHIIKPFKLCLIIFVQVKEKHKAKNKQLSAIGLYSFPCRASAV